MLKTNYLIVCITVLLISCQSDKAVEDYVEIEIGSDSIVDNKLEIASVFFSRLKLNIQLDTLTNTLPFNVLGLENETYNDSILEVIFFGQPLDKYKQYKNEELGFAIQIGDLFSNFSDIDQLIYSTIAMKGEMTNGYSFLLCLDKNVPDNVIDTVLKITIPNAPYFSKIYKMGIDKESGELGIIEILNFKKT